MASGKGKGKKRPPAKRPPAARAQGTRPPATTGTAGDGSAPIATTPAAGTPQPAKVKATRAERLEAARRARQRKALLTRAGIAGAVALLVLIVAVVVVNDKKDAKADQARLTAGSCTYDTRSDRTDPAPGNHVPPASYKVDPPAGGNHDPSPPGAGLYDKADQSPPTDARLVHSLEHGFVVLWHRPDLDEADLDAIHGVFDDHSDDVIVVRRASLKGKVVATSWGRRLLCGEVEPARLSEFVDLYKNKSPEGGIR